MHQTKTQSTFIPLALDFAWFHSLIGVKFLFVICLFMNSLPAQAGRGKDWFHRLDSFLERRYYSGSYDTLYFTRPHNRITIRNREGLSGTGWVIKSTKNGELQTSRLEAARRFVVSLGVSYRGLMLSYSLNPAKIKGSYKDFEFETNEYNNKWGFDVVLQNTNTLSGTQTISGKTTQIEPGQIHQISVYLDAFYTFNKRRFSYAAAFSQSYIQKKSAGSWLVGGSFLGSNINVRGNANLGVMGSHMRFIQVGLGGGYGYNYVPAEGWLIHVSSLPHLIVFDRSRLEIDDDNKKFHYRFPEVQVTARFAVVRNFKHGFLGTQIVANYLATGRKKNAYVGHNKWRSRIFFGLRF